MELKELLKPEKKDVAAIKKKVDEVSQLVQKMSAEMYQKVAQEQAKKQQQGQAGTSTGTKRDSGKKGEKVVDAEYKVEDEKKGKKKEK